MRHTTLLLLFCAFLSASCSNSVTGPNGGQNLLTNSTFEINGKPSLEGWVVPDTSAVHFSSDVPQGGSGSSIVMHIGQFAPWPGNSVFATVIPPQGTHSYSLSVFDMGAGGGVFVYLNRPNTSNSSLVASLRTKGTASWVLSTQTDTLSTMPGDTVFVTISGGGSPEVGGTSYYNTCTFELLK